jgi:GMP synthase-like glutamine amidotransferase
MSNCLVIQHAAAEPSYAIADALAAAGVDLDVRRVFAGEQVPDDASGVDGVVVMGGPMSAMSDVGFASRRAETALLADAVRLGVPTLGICLGAQLLAAAGGGPVRRGEAGLEIGWGPIDLLDERRSDALFSGLPEQLTVLHWHGDTFDLPAGATRLAANARYENQAFRLGEVAWGLQFHLEVTKEAVARFLEEFASEAVHAPGGGDAIASASDAVLGELATARSIVLERFAGLVVRGVATSEGAGRDVVRRS